MTRSETGAFSLLPPLELRRDAEGNVESLDHYVCRLAYCAGLGSGALSRMLYCPPMPPGRGGLHSSNRSGWIGPGDLVQETVHRLTIATGVPDLHRATFLNLSPALASRGISNVSSASTSRRWCPVCYLKWDEDSSFEPLCWAFGALSLCPIHSCRMHTRCQRCGCRQRHSTKYSDRRHCRCCRAPLGYNAEVIAASAYPRWINRQCVTTAHAASNTDRPVDPDCFDRYFARVLSRWRGGEPIPGYVKASMSSLEWRWNQGERNLKPTIMQYLNFAAFHGTNVDEIMLSPESAAAEPLVEGAWRSFTHFSLRRPLKGKIRYLQIALEKLLESDIPQLPTIGTMCAFLEIEVHYARKCAPKIVEAYSARAAAQRKWEGDLIHRRAFACAIAIARNEENDASLRNNETTINAIAARARCRIEIALWAHQAALITVSCLSAEGFPTDVSRSPLQSPPVSGEL